MNFLSTSYEFPTKLKRTSFELPTNFLLHSNELLKSLRHQKHHRQNQRHLNKRHQSQRDMNNICQNQSCTNKSQCNRNLQNQPYYYEKSVWLDLQILYFWLQVIHKLYRQVLTPVYTSQLLLKLVSLDKLRFITFLKTTTQRKHTLITGSYQFISIQEKQEFS